MSHKRRRSFLEPDYNDPLPTFREWLFIFAVVVVVFCLGYFLPEIVGMTCLR